MAPTPPPLPKESPAAPVPITVGEYRVLRPIGSGGMGMVFEAIQPVICKRVAIKVLRPELARDPRVASQLLTEARAISAIGHRGVVDVYNLGQLPNGQQYLVMELLNGQPLDAVLESRGRLPDLEVLRLLDEILDALAAAHAAGILHRDLKPSNVFIVTPPTGDSYVKLLDFGLACAVGTSSGLLIGTPRFMAPEQLRREPATALTDLFAVGVMSFMLLTGELPFEGASLEEVAAAHVKGFTRRKVLAGTAPGLARLVASLLETDPERRPPSAQAARDLVRAIAADLAPAAAPRGLFGKLRAALGRPTPAPSVDLSRRPPSLSAPVRTPAPPAKPAASPPRPPGPTQAVATAPAAHPTVEITLEDLTPLEREDVPILSPEQLRAIGLRVLDRVRRMDKLPAFPAGALRVVQFINRADADVNELARLITQDPSLSVQVLRMANSAFASRGVEIKTVRDAVTRLGFREVASVAAAASTLTLFTRELRSRSEVFQQAQLRGCVQALATAFGASWLSMQHRRGDADKAFLGGLLHDIGNTLILIALSDPAVQQELGGVDLAAVLEQLLEVLHVEVGARMAIEWNLPPWLIQICREHHEPQPGPTVVSELHMIRMVSAIAEMRLTPRWALQRLEEIELSAKVLGLDRFQVRATSSQVGEFITKAKLLAGGNAAR